MLYIKKTPSFRHCVLNKCTQKNKHGSTAEKRDLLSITSCIQTSHWTLSLATAIHSLPSHPVSLKVHSDYLQTHMLLHALPH